MKTAFPELEEQQIAEIKQSVVAQANHDLRRIFGITKRLKKMVETLQKDEWGNPIEDWDKVSTNELINIFSEASAWNFYSSPIKMQAFVESSLSDIVYKTQYNSALLTETGTVAEKTAQAEQKTLDSCFAATYKKMYSQYVTDVLRSYDAYLKRLEKIIDYRQKEERLKSPF